MKTAIQILIEKDCYQEPTGSLTGRVISSNVYKFTDAMEEYADQFKTKWYDPSVIPKPEAFSVYTIDDEGSQGLMYVERETWLTDAKDQGVSKWTYPPEPPTT